MASFLDLITPEPLAGLREKIRGFAVSAGLRMTNWIEVSVGQQTYEYTVATANAVTQVIAKAIRGYGSLDTSVDPNDEDPFDPVNVTLPPEPGFLSSFGANTFGTPRTEAKFASGQARFRNDGSVARTISPSALVFTYTPPVGAAVTYHNTADPTIYTNPDGTLTVNQGESAFLPVQCDIIGSAGTCPTGGLSLTTTLLGCSATNESALIGSDRQSAASYRTQCRTANARLSLAGPSSAYEQLAMKNLDGTPLMNAATPPTPVGITRAYVSQDSSTGIVIAYYATDSGAAIADDVTAANKNIYAQAFAVPDAITFDGLAAIEQAIHVAGSAEIEFREGFDTTTIINAILAALAGRFKEFPLGGVDRVDGAGFVYSSDLQGIAGAAYAGLYKVRITTPAGESTAVALGHVAILQSAISDWTINIVTPS